MSLKALKRKIVHMRVPKHVDPNNYPLSFVNLRIVH
jgi:hypothetical protein